MKAVVFEDVERVRVGDVPDPAIEDPSDAIVRVTTAAICGSDLHFYHGKAPLSPGETIGHEGGGVVEAVGPEGRRFDAGGRGEMGLDIVCGRCWFCLHRQSSLWGGFRSIGDGTR